MRTIAFYSIKGGVGKTASAVNIAYLAARDGLKTLLCELDPQGSASFYLRVRPAKKQSGKGLIKNGKDNLKFIKASDFENLDILPGDISYRNLDIVLDDLKRSKKRLAEALSVFKKEYDLVVLDCPPNLTLMSENIFDAAQRIFIPLIPTTLSINSWHQINGFYNDQGLNEKRLIPFFSMVEKRKKMHQEIMAKFETDGLPNLKTHIPYSADVEKMGLERKPLHTFRPKGIAAIAYDSLWQEIKFAAKLIGKEY